MKSASRSPQKSPSRGQGHGAASAAAGTHLSSPPRRTSAASMSTPTTPPSAMLLSSAALAAGSPSRKRASPGSSATISSPVRSTPAVTSARTRYLQEIAMTFADGQDMWHLMTTIPFEFEDKCKELGALFEAHKTAISTDMQSAIDNYATQAKQSTAVQDKKDFGVKKAEIVEDLKRIRKFIDKDNFLHETIYNCLFDTNGVYYLVSARGDIAKCFAFTPHSAHGLIFERRNGSFKTDPNGKPIVHDEKAVGTAVMIGRTIEIINIIAKYSKKLPHLLILTNKLESFAQYLDLHKRCLEHSIAYDPKAPKSTVSQSTQLVVSEFLLQWHPYPIQQITPERPDSSVILFNQDHMSRKTARSSLAASASTSSTLATPGISTAFGALLTSASYTTASTPTSGSSSSSSKPNTARNLFGS